ncbi:MAG: GIY-YIG nuclease family protein [Pseudomonadota bacterium]
MALELLDVKELANLLKCCESKARRLKIPHYRIGRHVRYELDEVLRWQERSPEIVSDRAFTARLLLQSYDARSEGCFVYFIATKDQKYCKIGITTHWPYRFYDLQHACPLDLASIAVFPGTEHGEKLLHRRFKTVHHRGEWFRVKGNFKRLLRGITEIGGLGSFSCLFEQEPRTCLQLNLKTLMQASRHVNVEGSTDVA